MWTSGMLLLHESHVKYIIYCICHAHPTILCWLHVVIARAVLQIHRQNSYVGPLRLHRTNTNTNNLTASSRYIQKQLLTMFTTTYCYHVLRSYSGFRLPSMIASKTTSWMFLPSVTRSICHDDLTNVTCNFIGSIQSAVEFHVKWS